MEYPKKPKNGDIVICLDDDSDDLDLGMSGIVLKGRKDLVIGQQYTISSLPWDFDTNVPKKNTHWTDDEFPMIRWGWHRVYLEGISDSVFLHNFKPFNGNEHTKS
jgi:hypothetical protein